MKAIDPVRYEMFFYRLWAMAKKVGDELRPEYDLSQLKGGVRGKYYKRAMAGTNLVLIEPDLSKAFYDADSMNRALRLLVDAVSFATTPHRKRTGQNKRLTRTGGTKTYPLCRETIDPIFLAQPLGRK